MLNSLLLRVKDFLGTSREDRGFAVGTSLKEMIKKDSGLAFIFCFMFSTRKLSNNDNSEFFIHKNVCSMCCYLCEEDCSRIQTDKYCQECISSECIVKTGKECGDNCEFCHKVCVYSPWFDIKQLTKNC